MPLLRSTQPTFAVQLDVLDGFGQAEAGIFLELPRVSLDAVTLTQKNFECNTPNSSTPADAYTFDTLLNLVPSVDLILGVEASAELADDIYQVSTSATTTLTSLPLPTACLDFDIVASTFAPATLPAAATTSAIGGTQSGVNGVKGGGHPREKSSSLSAGEIAGIVVGSIVGASSLLGACAFLFLRRRKHLYVAPPENNEPSVTQVHESKDGVSILSRSVEGSLLMLRE